MDGSQNRWSPAKNLSITVEWAGKILNNLPRWTTYEQKVFGVIARHAVTINEFKSLFEQINVISEKLKKEGLSYQSADGLLEEIRTLWASSSNRLGKFWIPVQNIWKNWEQNCLITIPSGMYHRTFSNLLSDIPNSANRPILSTALPRTFWFFRFKPESTVQRVNRFQERAWECFSARFEWLYNIKSWK